MWDSINLKNGNGVRTAITAQLLIGECVRRGVKREKLLNDAGIGQQYMKQVCSGMSLNQFYTLWDEAIGLTADHMLALHVAEKVPFGAYHLIDYITAASATPGKAMLHISRSISLLNSALHLSLRRHKNLAYIELHSLHGPQDLPRPYIEYIFASILMRFRFTTQVKWRPCEIQVTYGKPGLAKEYDRVFEAPVRFRMGVNRMVVPSYLMEVGHPIADPEICEVLESLVKRKLREPHADAHPLVEIQDALTESLRAGNTSLTDLSRRLATSRRSLQRQLQERGLSFRKLLDNLRHQRAVDLLQERALTVSQIASQLQFSDGSSFCHAFERWTGSSPRQYRRNMSR